MGDDGLDEDRSPEDRSHGNGPHEDRSHGNGPHEDRSHGNGPHEDRSHGNGPHEDRSHGNGPHEDRLGHVLGLVRERGGRMTTARRALVGALVAGGHHLTADDLAERISRSHPDVHRSTIYRTLDALERMGVVDHVHLGHGRAVYHLSDEAHHHLVCDTCGAVVEVPDSAFENLSQVVARDYGFVLRARHFALLGRCARCGADEG